MTAHTSTEHRCRVVTTPWPGIHGTEVLSGRHFGRHWHAHHGFGLLEQGAHNSASARGRVDAYAGDLITTNPGEVHDGRPLGAPARRWRMLYLEPGILAAMPHVPGAPLRREVELVRPVLRDAPLRRVLRQLFARLDDWAAGRQAGGTELLACEESLVHACGLLLARHAVAAVAVDVPADLRQVRERLADDLLRPPTLAELAALAGLSRYQLLRRFQKAHGLPPHAWLAVHRAERARGLIAAGQSLAQAAAACGFADQSHMTRSFVRHLGFTPGAWRQAACNRVQDDRT